jgi:hypothetical protein
MDSHLGSGPLQVGKDALLYFCVLPLGGAVGSGGEEQGQEQVAGPEQGGDENHQVCKQTMLKYMVRPVQGGNENHQVCKKTMLKYMAGPEQGHHVWYRYANKPFFMIFFSLLR